MILVCRSDTSFQRCLGLCFLICEMGELDKYFLLKTFPQGCESLSPWKRHEVCTLPRILGKKA